MILSCHKIRAHVQVQKVFIFLSAEPQNSTQVHKPPKRGIMKRDMDAYLLMSMIYCANKQQRGKVPAVDFNSFEGSLR